MAQPDISQILAALGEDNSTTHSPAPRILIAAKASQQPAPSNGTSQAPTPAQQAPPGYPPAGMSAPTPSAPPPQPAPYLPQPSNTGSVDLSAIKPVNSGSVSIADAIAKAKSIAADRGVQSFDPRSGESHSWHFPCIL
jgi:hypothetical protein